MIADSMPRGTRQSMCAQLSDAEYRQCQVRRVDECRYIDPCLNLSFHSFLLELPLTACGHCMIELARVGLPEAVSAILLTL